MNEACPLRGNKLERGDIRQQVAFLAFRHQVFDGLTVVRIARRQLLGRVLCCSAFGGRVIGEDIQRQTGLHDFGPPLFEGAELLVQKVAEQDAVAFEAEVTLAGERGMFLAVPAPITWSAGFAVSGQPESPDRLASRRRSLRRVRLQSRACIGPVQRESASPPCDRLDHTAAVHGLEEQAAAGQPVLLQASVDLRNDSFREPTSSLPRGRRAG